MSQESDVLLLKKKRKILKSIKSFLKIVSLAFLFASSSKIFSP